MNNPYQSPTATLPESGTPLVSTGLVLFGVVLSALPAVTCWLVLEQFQEVFEGFGVELPLLTELVLSYHQLLWLVPVALAILVIRSRPAARTRRAVLGGVVCALVLLPICVVAMYLPIFKLGAVVG